VLGFYIHLNFVFLRKDYQVVILIEFDFSKYQVSPNLVNIKDEGESSK
jgi:hypothetical protein